MLSLRFPGAPPACSPSCSRASESGGAAQPDRGGAPIALTVDATKTGATIRNRVARAHQPRSHASGHGRDELRRHEGPVGVR